MLLFTVDGTARIRQYALPGWLRRTGKRRRPTRPVATPGICTAEGHSGLAELGDPVTDATRARPRVGYAQPTGSRARGHRSTPRSVSK